MIMSSRSLLVLFLVFTGVVVKADLFDAVRQDSQVGFNRYHPPCMVMPMLQADLKAALAAGEDINTVQGGTGQTPLMNAVLSGKLLAVKYLLRKGADTTIGEKDGYTPMVPARVAC